MANRVGLQLSTGYPGIRFTTHESYLNGPDKSALAKARQPNGAGTFTCEVHRGLTG
ncbi:hypothetical protein EMIT0196MI5_50321 [Pseudomonas sp. IT-196MI5]